MYKTNRIGGMCGITAGLGMLMAAGSAISDVMVLSPSADTVLDERRPDNNSGASDWIKSGTSGNGDARRGLVEFDIAGSIAAGSTIHSATLTLTITDGSQSVADTHSLHLGLTDWNEGNNTGRNGSAAQAGEATWNTSGITSWGTAGGQAGIDYVSSVSASTPIGSSTGSFAWTGLQADVQFWLDNPSSNYGWFVIGVSGADETARRYDSREGTVAPQLVINYTVIPEPHSLALAVFGGLGLLAWKQRKRRNV